MATPELIAAVNDAVSEATGLWPQFGAASMLMGLAGLMWRSWNKAPTAWVLEQLDRYEHQALLDAEYIDTLREEWFRNGKEPPKRKIYQPPAD